MTQSLEEQFAKAKSNLKQSQEVSAAQASELQINESRLRNWMGATNIIYPLYVSSVSQSPNSVAPNVTFISNTAKESAQLAYALLKDSVSAGCPVTEATAPGLYRHYLGRSAKLVTDILTTNSNVPVASLLRVMQGLFFAISNRTPHGYDAANGRIIKNIITADIQAYLSSVAHAQVTTKYTRNVSMHCSLYNLAANIHTSIDSRTQWSTPSHMAVKAILNTSVMGLMDAWSDDFKQMTQEHLSANKTDTVAMFIQNTSKLVSNVGAAVLSNIVENDPHSVVKPTFPATFQRQMYPVLDQLMKLTGTYASAISKNSDSIINQLRDSNNAPSPSLLSVDAWCSFLTLAHECVIQTLESAGDANTIEDLLYTATDILIASAKVGIHYEQSQGMSGLQPITRKHIHESMMRLTSYLCQFYEDTRSLNDVSVSSHPIVRGVDRITAKIAETVRPLLVHALKNTTLTDTVDNTAKKWITSLVVDLTRTLGCARYSRYSGNYIAQSVTASIGATISLYRDLTSTMTADDVTHSEMLFDCIFNGVSETNVLFLRRHMEDVSGAPLEILTDEISASYLVTDYLERIGTYNQLASDFVKMAEAKISQNLVEGVAAAPEKKPIPDQVVGR